MVDQVTATLLTIRSRESFVPTYSSLTPARVIECKVQAPTEWDRPAIESDLGVTLPDEVVELWHTASEIRLHDDVNYGQWGCILWSPSEIVQRHLERVSWRGSAENFLPGDLLIGEFRGDAELVVVRCDPFQRDYGSVLIGLPMDPRSDWPRVANSLLEFIQRFVAQPDKKYWEK